MEKFLPYFTGDGSVGLYSDEFNDIYHSAYGALSEAYEKFVLHLDIEKESIRVLDVCFGLGYNSKAFLNNNKHKNIIFDCLDIDKDLFLLSPFIKTNKSMMVKKYSQKFLPKEHKEKINKYISKSKRKKYKIDAWVNYILIKNLAEQFTNNFWDNYILKQKEFSSYFDKNMVIFAKNYSKYRSNTIKHSSKLFNLHNIYYWYLSKRYKIVSSEQYKFNFYVGDARKTIQNIDTTYDVIFLDAFTTDKCPQLWSIDFIKELFSRTSNDGVLITYSTSAVVRNTLLESGYFTGKIIGENNKPIGTIASKNPNKIKKTFSNYELGLLKTKAGIPYRDEILSSDKEEILNRRKLEVKHSNLISSSKYIKEYKGKKI